MTLTRRQLSIIFAVLYGAAGLLLLRDYLSATAEPGAHLPLAWHVFPISAAATVLALLMDRSAPLDPVWFVPVGAVVTAYLVALIVCTVALQQIVGGRASASRDEGGSDDALNTD